MDNYKYTIWCRDKEQTLFSVAHCLSAKDADATRGMFAAVDPDCSFFITREKDDG